MPLPEQPADSSAPPTPGATYRFTVRSADEAVRTIRERLGENAKVLSVRQVSGDGLTGLFSKPKLEVVVQVGDPANASTLESPAESPATSGAGTALFNSDEPAMPTTTLLSRRESRPASATDANAYGAAPRLNPPPADMPTRLPELLRRSGFSESMLSHLEAIPAFAQRDGRPLHESLADVGRSLRKTLSARPRKPLPLRTAFLGTPGVGRTTALCKWLAREVFARQQTGRVIKAEFDRPNPAEGLAVFCEALGLSLEYHSPLSPDAVAEPGTVPTASAAPRSELISAPGFLYVDLPGLSLRSPAENQAQARFLDDEKIEGRVLVLNAAYDVPALRRAYTAGRDLGATHLVFTHLDEIEHWAKLWDFLLDGSLSPLFLATGPSLTGDCEEDALGAVLRRTLPGA